MRRGEKKEEKAKKKKKKAKLTYSLIIFFMFFALSNIIDKICKELHFIYSLLLFIYMLVSGKK
jgi:hypothetical protein